MGHHLPSAERDVLGCLHRLERATARELCDAMSHYRPMAHGSMSTLLKRLEAKGMVSKEKSARGKAFIFRPGRRHRSTFRGLVKDLLHRVFHGDGVALVASLFETKAPTPEQIDRLERMLADLRKVPPSKTAKGR